MPDYDTTPPVRRTRLDLRSSAAPPPAPEAAGGGKALRLWLSSAGALSAIDQDGTEAPIGGADEGAIQDAVDAAIAALIDGAPGALNTLNELAAALNDDASFAATVTTALAAKQPLDADLTAIAALTTTSFGRSLLAAADAAALRALAEIDLSGYIAASILTADGDLLYRQPATNWATTGQGASASSIDGGNDGSPNDLLDGNDSTGFNSFNFNPDRILVDLGQARSVASCRLVQANGLTNTVEYGSSSSGPWTKVVDAQAAGGGTPKVSIYSWTTVSARYWRFTPNTTVGGNYSGWKTIELLSPAMIGRLAKGTDGQVLKMVSGVPAWATDAT